LNEQSQGDLSTRKGKFTMLAIKEPMTHDFDAKSMLTALTALKKGDFSVRLPIGLTDIDGEIGEAFNDVV